MKSKFELQTHIHSEFRDIEREGEHSNFKYPLKARTERKHRVNTREFSPIRYMWESSIPETWFRLAEPSLFMNMRVQRQKSRNTLQFLEETQKYIYNIRKPMLPRKMIQNVKRRSNLSTANLTVKPLATASSFKNFGITENTLINGNKQELIPRCSSIDRFKQLFNTSGKMK